MGTVFKKHADKLLTFAVSGVGFVLYALTAAPSTLMADGGEFQFVPYIAGITHPTGYPLYTILGWVWTHLVVAGDVAYRMNLFSVLWGAVTLGLLYQVALRSFRLVMPECPPPYRQSLSVLVALLFAVSGTFWSQAVIAEVYTLNSAFVAAILYLALRLRNVSIRGENPTAWLVALSFAYGLSLTHHRTMTLMFPSLVILVWWVARKTGFSWHRVVPVILAGLILPQILYLYIPLRAPYAPYAELQLDAGRTLVLYENSLSGFLDLVFAGAFGGQLAEGPITSGRLAMAFDLLLHQFTWAGIFLGVIGLASLLRRRAWIFLLLTLLPYLMYVTFNLIYFIGDIYVLFIPSYLIGAIWIGFEVWELAHLIAGAIASKKESVAWPAILITCASFILPIWLLFDNYALVDQSQNRTAAQMWQPILAQPLPEDSILVSNDRDEIMPMWYYQYVDGLKPGWLGLFPLIVRQPGYGDVSQVIHSALSSDRPVFLIKPMPGLELKYQLEATGPLARVLHSFEGQKPAHALDITFGESIRLTGYDQKAEAGDTLEIVLYWEGIKEVDRSFSSFVHLVDSSGQTIAGHDHRPGGSYYPTNLWKPGEVLLDKHILTVPPAASGIYTLTTGLYAWPSMERLGEEAVVGQIR